MRQTQVLWFNSTRRFFRFLPGVAAALCVLAGTLTFVAGPALADDTPAARRAAADAQFARAEAMRADLEAKPERLRSVREYEQLVAAYRHVYLITPRAPEVPGAIKQVADLYRHMGEQFEHKYFQSAVETYQFLVRDYPTSSLRPDALLAIADIEHTNLADANLAQQSYQDFLKQYPHSSHAADARRALAEMKTGDDVTVKTAVAPRPAAVPKAVPASVETSVSDSGETSEVGHVRVWNADNYTRIVIDLGGQAKYQTARISNPDRIYFDFQNARLGPGLAHESIDVPEGGYLKAVRVAQNRANAVRVVLDVAKVKDYSVFELANPDRLVVDVYGPGADIAKAKANAATDKPSAEGVVERSTTEAAAAPRRTAATAPPAPSTLRVKSATTTAPSLEANAPAMPGHAATRTPAAATAPTPVSARASAPETSPAEATTTSADARAAAIPETVPSGTRDPFATPRGVMKTKSSRKTVAASAPAAAVRPPLESAKAAADSIGPPSLPERTKNGERSLTRALGLKIGRIVIDAGHGGHDTGTIGPTGLMEKDLCLDVALRLGKLIQQQLPSTEVTYTRDDDTFVPLEQRTAIANEAKADLFLSVHANSSDDHRTSGIETYYLNFNASPQAMEVATRENATAQSSVHDLQELVTKIARNEKIEESRDLASDIQDSLAKSMEKNSHSERDRGVRQAPFVVLIGADMPSVLAEISFLSNPTDEQWLKKPENRQRIAEGLFHGVENYLQSTNSLTTDLASSTPGPRQQ